MKKEMAFVDGKTIKDNLIGLKNIVFEVTEKCNLCCKYCGLSERLYQKYDEREYRDLPFEKAKVMIDYLLDIWRDNYVENMNMPFVVSFYGGEPLLNMPLIEKIVDYIEKSNVIGREIHYAMTTNAMLLDKYIDFLVEKNFNLAISLDGDEVGQSYRVDGNGNNSYKRVIQNVRLLKGAYPDYFNEVQVMFVSVLHNRNDVEPLLAFFEDNFKKTPLILPLSTVSVSEDKKDEFRKMYQNKYQSLVKSPNCEAIVDKYFTEMPQGLQLSQFLYHTSGNIFYNYNQLLMQKYGKNYVSTGSCTPFSKKLFLAVDGKILPCERVGHDFEMGRVCEGKVDLDYEHVADLHNHYLSKVSGQCLACAASENCYQCVYHIDDIRNKSAHCPNFCTSEMFESEKERNLIYLRDHPHYYKRVLNEISFTL